jgi:cytochrome P450
VPARAAVDLYDAGVVADPFAAYETLRAQAPAHRLPESDVWALSRYQDVIRSASDPGRFSSGDTNGLARRSLKVLVGTDGAEHARLRRHAARALAPPRLASLLPRADAIVAACAGAFVDGGGGDAVAALAEPAASGAFADLLGLEPDRLAARRRGRGLSPDPRRAWRAFFLEAVARRRAQPAADVISALTDAAPDGDRLSDEEIVGMLGLLLAAGADTTRDLLANLLAELAARPAEWQRLLEQPTLAGSAVDEALRFASPIQGTFRTATVDVDVAGVTIPARSRVMLLFGSADRDERRWPDAARFDVGRYADGLARGCAHVAFGSGPHACPGAHVARRIARAVLDELLHRRICLSPAGEPRYGSNPSFRSPRSLPLRVTPAPAPGLAGRGG